MIKRILLFVCSSLFSATLLAQTPTYTSQNGTSDNSSPWGNTTFTKVQWIYYPADFTPAISAGLITKVYIKLNSNMSNWGSKRYANFIIGMGTTTATTLANPTPWHPVTYVYNAPAVTFTQVQGEWVEIPLQTPFYYDGVSNIILEGSQTSYTLDGMSVVQNTANGNGRRMWGNQTGASSTGSGNGSLYWGFDLYKNNDITPAKLVSPNLNNLCSEKNDIVVRVKNLGILDVATFKVNWSIDNVLQTPIVINSTLQANGSVDSLDINLGSIELSLNTATSLKVWTSDPNNTTDPNKANDTLTAPLFASHQGININPIPDTTLCIGKTVTISAGYNANTDYTWSNGTQAQQAEFNTVGTHWIYAYNVDGCMYRDSFKITEIQKPIAGTNIAVIDKGAGQFTFDIANAENVDFYEWDYGDGSPLEYGPGPKSHTYRSHDSFHVTLRMGNVCDTITRNLLVVHQQNTNSNDLIFDQKISVYPVPFAQTLNIKTKGQEQITNVYLYNAVGQLVYESLIQSHNTILNLEKLSTGQYLIKVNIGDHYYTKPIIKE